MRRFPAACGLAAALALAACAPAAPPVPEPAAVPAGEVPAAECDSCTLHHRDMARRRAVMQGAAIPPQ